MAIIVEMTSSQTTSSHKSLAGCLSVLAVLAGFLLQAKVSAATVPDLYVAQVPVTETSGAGLDEAFSRALAEVMVKLTGQRSPLADPAVRGMIGSAAPLVSQYQVAGGGLLRVQFDPTALRRRLDAANLPVWAAERPETLIMLVGEGAPAGDMDMPVPDALAGDGQILLDTAASRGLPVALLLSRRISPLPLMIRLRWPARKLPGSGPTWCWSGVVRPSRARPPGAGRCADGAERSEWQGDATQGVHQVADQLAARYAVAAAASRRLRFEVQGVASFADYARLQDYLRGVGVIESLSIAVCRATASITIWSCAVVSRSCVMPWR